MSVTIFLVSFSCEKLKSAALQHRIGTKTSFSSRKQPDDYRRLVSRVRLQQFTNFLLNQYVFLFLLRVALIQYHRIWTTIHIATITDLQAPRVSDVQNWESSFRTTQLCDGPAVRLAVYCAVQHFWKNDVVVILKTSWKKSTS